MINYSFIIPHYNNPYLLDRCLNSIPQREDIEIIVIDDNSRIEKKPKITRKDVNLIMLSENESKGAGKARNVGLSLAKGKWVLFADSDDFYTYNFLDELDKLLTTSYDIIIFDAYWCINLKTGDVYSNRLTLLMNKYEKEPLNFKIKQLLMHSNNACWNKMYKRSYLIKIKAKFDEVLICNDGWFVQYTSSNTDNVYFINKKLYYYIKNDIGITQKKRPISEIIESFYTTKRIHNYMYDIGVSYCIPPFRRGIKSYFKRYNFITAIYILIKKTFIDSPLQRFLRNFYKLVCDKK